MSKTKRRRRPQEVEEDFQEVLREYWRQAKRDWRRKNALMEELAA